MRDDMGSSRLERLPGEEKVKQVQGLFDRVAKRYDLMNTILSFGIHHIWKRTAIKLLCLRHSDRVIDVCGGTGDLSLLSAKRMGHSGRVILYDMNRNMIDAGRPRIKRSRLGDRIQFVQGNAEQISFRDSCFDAAVVGFGIRNLADAEGCFREMYRIIKPGGKLLCLEFSHPTSRPFRSVYDFYSCHIIPRLGGLVGSGDAYAYLTQSIRAFPPPDKIAAILRDIGFRNVSYQSLTKGIAAIHSARK